MPRRKKIKSRKKILNAKRANLKQNGVSINTFVLAVLSGTAIFILLIAIISFGTLIVKSFYNYRLLSRLCSECSVSPLDKITYVVDRAAYKITDSIKLNIANNSSRPIYLAPCQYFTNFERKTGKRWQKANSNNCSADENQTSNSFEKVPEKVEETIAASSLGEGLWRGISTIYFDCRETKKESCRTKHSVYSNEFKIEAPAADMKVNPVTRTLR